MVKITEYFYMEAGDEVIEGSENQINLFYQKAREDFLDFLTTAKLKILR